MDKIKEMIDRNLATIDAEQDPIKYTKRVTVFLSKLHPSDAYVIIRDTIIPTKNKRISLCKTMDTPAYQEFQNLRMECKKSFDHDKSYATNLDVDKAVSKAYGIAMRTLRANMDMEKVRFDKLTKAINRIEEHLGLDVTDFGEGEEIDSAEHENAQNVEGTTAEVGEPCETE